VLIHGGSGNGSAKRWPAASWGRFADRVAQETGSRVVLAGGPADLPVGQEIEAAAECPLVSLVGETTIPELVALVERADLVASGDSGPLHLAVALGRPLLAAYGPTDPAIYGPFKPTGPVRLHRRDLPCSPCYTGDLGTSECPLGHNLCMKLITVSEMVESAVALLATV
jgi:ADP-heptose:LPS heptosyltransferase